MVPARYVMALHYAGYFGSMGLLLLALLLGAAGAPDAVLKVVLGLLAVSSLIFGVVGAAYVVGGRRG